MANPLSCLICSSAVIKDNDVENIKRSQFQLGLQLFCKLLKINGNYVNQLISCGGRGHDGEDAADIGPPPCCKECYLTFEQILRLQQAIELMQTNLMEQLDKIKATLRTSVSSDFEEEDPLKIPPDDILGKIRDQLLSCVRKSCTPSSSTSVTQPNRKRKQPVSKSSQHPSLKKAKEHLACSVILECLPLNHLNILPKTEPPSTYASTEDNSDLDDVEYLPSPEEASSSPLQDNHDDNEDEDDYPWESEAKPIPELLPNQFISNSGPIKKSKFCLISPDILLYQNTLIKVSQGYTHFTCQEPECPSPSFSDASLNWNNLFKQIAQHIESTHNTFRYDLLIACPLCPESFPRSHQLRSHLISCPRAGRKLDGHGIQTVICEICWKPIRNLADAYRCHQWLHKNNQEKEESPEGLPPTLLSKVNRRLRKLGKLAIKKVKPKVLPKPKPKKKISHLRHKTIWPPSPKPALPFQDNLEDDDHQDEDEYPWESESEPIPEQLPNRTTVDDPTISSSDHNDNGDRTIRKIKLRALEFIRNNSTPQKAETTGELDQDNCSDFNDDEYVPAQDDHDDDNEDEDEYPWESEAKPIPEQLPNQISSKCETGRKSSKFSLISPHTLLYQYTLIKVSQGYTHFTCQEPACPSPHFSDASLNWNNLFKQMAHHINDFHGTPPSKTKLVKCPLCPASKLAGPQFRAHLVSCPRSGRKRKANRHHIDTVACDICWKPIRNQSDAYRCHQWKHKNDLEKEQSQKEIPPNILSKIIKKAEKKKHEKKLIKSSKLAKKRIPIKSNINPTSLNPTTFKGTPKICNHFARILENSTESLLLYKYTLLKASYGISLSCQESNCDHIINGTDFPAFEHFKTHVKNCHSHSTQKSDTIWKCPLCSEHLQTCFSFRRHLLFNCSTASYTANNSFPFICTVCWRSMTSVTQLEYHQWLHKSESEKDSEGQPPPKLVQLKEKERKSGLKCRHCERVFRSSANLKAHEATHLPKEQRKKYLCHQCPKQFLSPVAVRGHVEREHQRELMRLRSCPICSKQFNWRDGHFFQSHLKSHRNERDFVCDVCGKEFLAGEYLKKHKENAHEGKVLERRWQCEFCERRYQKNFLLTRHKRNAHKDKVREEDEGKGKEVPLFIGPRIAFHCPVCEKTFPLKSRMKKHWEKSHKNK